ncbi:hypothetical protein FJ492_20580 [Mesorhizobium sp. B2-5-4]|uniref:hypothetical protein n=1 Tax=Mesorhizobium sp. B2-5-4 TaxID=2589926 RepID=UPI00112D6E97|nr:hypothetical protein [Mesorhizobium sp. B2-5-4]TPK41387.1 hypothetical protein FJ492_20580 [Mesorhizobium sp. B2-5-4]
MAHFRRDYRYPVCASTLVDPSGFDIKLCDSDELVLCIWAGHSLFLPSSRPRRKLLETLGSFSKLTYPVYDLFVPDLWVDGVGFYNTRRNCEYSTPLFVPVDLLANDLSGRVPFSARKGKQWAPHR